MFKFLTILVLMLVSLTGCSNNSENTEVVENDRYPGKDFVSISECNLYVPDEEYSNFTTKKIEVSNDNVVKEVLNKLLEENVINFVPDINSVEVKEDCVKIDFNEIFLKNLENQGTSGERFVMGCLVNTLIDYYKVNGVELTVNGEYIETGHSIFNEIITKYE